MSKCRYVFKTGRLMLAARHRLSKVFTDSAQTYAAIIVATQPELSTCSAALQAELKHMQRLIGAGQCPIEDLDLVGDDLMKWRFKIRGFDDTTQGTAHGQCRWPPKCPPGSLEILTVPGVDARFRLQFREALIALCCHAELPVVKC